MRGPRNSPWLPENLTSLENPTPQKNSLPRRHPAAHSAAMSKCDQSDAAAYPNSTPPATTGSDQSSSPRAKISPPAPRLPLCFATLPAPLPQPYASPHAATRPASARPRIPPAAHLENSGLAITPPAPAQQGFPSAAP